MPDRVKGSPEPSQALQRVKVGMLGLAAVILLIGLASAIMRTATRDGPAGASGGTQAALVANMADGNASADPSGEPLAELGIAPSTGNAAATAGGDR